MYNQLKLLLLLAITTGANCDTTKSIVPSYLRQEAAEHMSKVHNDTSNTAKKYLEEFDKCAIIASQAAINYNNGMPACLNQLKSAMDRMFESRKTILEVERENEWFMLDTIGYLAVKAKETKAEAIRVEAALTEATAAVNAAISAQEY